jgi:hypothetical protein
MTRTYVKGLAVIAAILALIATNAPASTIIDLTDPGANNLAGDNTAALGGTFVVQQTSGQSTGGDVIDTFLRLRSRNPSEQGYNSDGPLEFDAKGSPRFTHSLLLSDVPTVSLTVNGVTELYRQFVLDINQTKKDPFLSLNQVQIFLRDSGNLDTASAVPPPAGITVPVPPVIAFVDPFSVEVFRLNNNNTANFLEIQLKDSGKSSSSPGDMFLYVRDAAFQAVDTTAFPFVYLYSQFGTPPGEFPNNRGPEDWGVLKSPPLPVPEPSTVALALTGLGTLSFAGLRRRRALQTTA